MNTDIINRKLNIVMEALDAWAMVAPSYGIDPSSFAQMRKVILDVKRQVNRSANQDKVQNAALK